LKLLSIFHQFKTLKTRRLLQKRVTHTKLDIYVFIGVPINIL